MNSIVDGSKDFIHQESLDATTRYEQTKWTLIVCVVPVLAGAMGYYLSAGIMKPVTYLKDVSKKVSSGDLTVKPEPMTQDELGSLTVAYGDTIAGSVEGLTQGAQKILAEARVASDKAMALIIDKDNLAVVKK